MNFTKKYEMFGDVRKADKWGSRKVRRIRALKDFGDVTKGDTGGWLWTTPEGNNFRATWRKGCIVSYFWSYDNE